MSSLQFQRVTRTRGRTKRLRKRASARRLLRIPRNPQRTRRTIRKIRLLLKSRLTNRRTRANLFPLKRGQKKSLEKSHIKALAPQTESIRIIHLLRDQAKAVPFLLATKF